MPTSFDNDNECSSPAALARIGHRQMIVIMERIMYSSSLVTMRNGMTFRSFSGLKVVGLVVERPAGHYQLFDSRPLTDYVVRMYVVSTGLLGYHI